MSDPPSADPARRSDRARRAILASTVDLIGERGFLAVSIEAIAARAGVGKQTIYRWWPTKSAVVLDALLDANADADDDDEGSVELPNSGDVAADLRLVVRAIVVELTDPATDRLQRTVTAEIQHDPELAHAVVERILQPQLDILIRRLRSAQADGQLSATDDPALVAELLVGPVFHRWLLRTAPLDEAYADRLVSHVLPHL